MITAQYEGWTVNKGSSGGSRITSGVRGVFIDIIPADAPQDWSMGPRMVPGEFGAFLNNSTCSRGHSQYAFEVGKTEESVRLKVGGHFASKVSDWKQVEEPEFAWEEE
jgi:hypothetical protein